MKKKIAVIVLSLILVLSFVQTAFAAGQTHQLAFDENGEFTVLHVCDIQDGYPVSKSCAQYLRETLNVYKPDLVVLGGDNTTASEEDKELAIKEICEIFVEAQTYFTLVFGNHDAENNMSREEQFVLYKLYGGEYCLAYDADESLTGVGTHNLTVLSSDRTRIAYNIYMFDSNMYVYDEKGEELGYDCVNPDQIDWYKGVSASLREQNGGEPVPAMAFQHIAPQEANEVLFVESPIPLGLLGQDKDGITYTYLPEFWKIKEGLMLEHPGSGYYNYGQFDAMAEAGDVEAVFFGHDHVNDYVIEKDGIEMINTPSCTFNSYADTSSWGTRLITINENDVHNYKTEIILVGAMALREGSEIISYGEITADEARASVFARWLGQLFIKATRYIAYEVAPKVMELIGGLV